jgi:hypothetical protein
MTKAKQIERAAAAYVSAPESFAHLEPSYFLIAPIAAGLMVLLQ